MDDALVPAQGGVEGERFMVTEIHARGRRRDRWSSWLVVAVVIVALILGWVVKTAAEGRTVPFAGEGLRATYPAGWVRVEVQAPVLLQVGDRWAQPFRSTLSVERRPLSPGSDNPLGLIQQMVSLERGRSLSAFRTLRGEQSVAVRGEPGVRVTFAYVATNPNPFAETLPVVMRGEDVIFLVGDSAYVVSLTTAAENYAQGQRILHRLLRTLET